MDVLRIERDTFNPDLLIEDYSSFIWTERFIETGEFELRTQNIESMKKRLPLNSLISHRESKEVCIVDTHLIEVDEEGKTELVVSGKSFEDILNYRPIMGGERFMNPKGQTWKLLRKYTSAEMAALLAWQHLVDHDPLVIAPRNDIFVDFYGITWRHLITNLRISNSSTLADKRENWRLEPGQVYDKLMEVLQGGENIGDDIGVRMIRPPYPSAKIQTFQPDGDPVKTVLAPIENRLLMDFYNGRDKTADVIFDAEAGHLANISYLSSWGGRHNQVVVDAEPNNLGITMAPIKVSRPSVTDSTAGLDLRVVYHLADPTPDEDEVAWTNTDENDRLKRAGRKVLRGEEKLTIVECEVSTANPYKFLEHYRLGDKVKVRGHYGTNITMRVEEYTHSVDANGERKFPTLAQI